MSTIPLADTILAPATGWPSAGARPSRTLLRLSGPDVPRILVHRLGVDPAHRSVVAARLRLPRAGAESSSADGPSPTLPCIVMRFEAPRSYTGEHAAELLIPAGPAILDRVIRSLTSCPGVSARPAAPGEFTARAYMNNKLTLAQAEGVAALIAARNEADLVAARRIRDGSLGRAYAEWADEVSGLLALVEAGIDFTDQEDVVPIRPVLLGERLGRLIAEVRGHLGSARGGESPDHRPVVVLAGPPNAGKSTLFNTLLGRPRAVVSDTPGTTRDALSEVLDLAAHVPLAPAVTLVDVAGLGAGPFASPADLSAQHRASDALSRADVVLLCDPRGEFHGEPFVRSLVNPGTQILRLRTKADIPLHHATEPHARPADELRADPALPICALDGFNLGSLRRAIADAASAAFGPTSASSMPLLPRHRRLLAVAVVSLASARDLTDADAERSHIGGPSTGPHHGSLVHPELIAVHLRDALDALGELVGRITPDDVLGRIFASFCVGK